MIKHLLPMIAFISLLSGCGGSGSGSDGGGSNEAATLSLSLQQVKSFNFTWNAVANADHYNLLENPDGMSGFNQVSAIAAGTLSYDHVVPLYARINAQYILQTCYSADDSNCVDSSTVSVNDTMASSVGYIKASNTDAGDLFGRSVALSGDGQTLAVGAYQEASNATGIDGNQADNSVSVPGAVYVYARSGSTWSQQAYIKASNTGAIDRFGFVVALSADGNTLAVSAYTEASNATGIDGNQADNSAANSGAVYIYTRNSNTWTQQAYIKASNTEMDDWFGAAVSLSADGQTLAVGAIGEDSNAPGIGGNQADNTAVVSGAVYVYTRSGNIWTQQAYIKASNTQANDTFGFAVSLSGDGQTLAVGAFFEDSNATGIGGNQADNSTLNSGAVYVFTRSGGVWTQQAYIKASNSGQNDFFGEAVALSSDGDTLAVGAYGEYSNATGIDGDQADNSQLGSGAVYVFTRSGGAWTQQAYIKASNTGGDDFFGDAVALSADGQILAVGAYREASNATGIGGDQTDNSASRSGAVYVFTQSGSVWTQQAYIKASNAETDDYFGSAVALSGDGYTLAVGAQQESSNVTGTGGNQTDNSAIASGAVYLY